MFLNSQPQALHTLSQAALRAKLVELVLSDLVGPAGGAQEEIAERNVRDRYLLGMLAPRYQRLSPEEQDAVAEGGSGTAEEGPSDADVSQAATLFPSSFGLTCCVDGDATVIVIGAHWGRYTRTKSEALLTERTGEMLTVWQRQPMGGSSPPIALKAGPIKPWVPDAEQPEVTVRGVVRRIEDSWIVTLFLINGQSEPESLRDHAWIFQPELSVAAPDDAPIFRQRALLHSLPGDLSADEERAIAMLYRREVEFAVGHGVSVHAEVDGAATTCARRITTSVAPTYEVPRTISPSAADMPALRGLELDMRRLAELPNEQLAAALMPLKEAYAGWIASQALRVDDPSEDLDSFRDVAHAALGRCREAMERIEAGIMFLAQSPQAAEAFRFMNRAMWLQRTHTLLAEQARRGQTPDLAQIDVPVNRSWRPFQLAFILLNIPGLTDLHHPDRSDAPDATADLLWFPTGGGKTEAYLGLTAYTLGIRRLQGTVAGRSGMDGVAVLMRYTLRLLTLQQFQRATALICACETIRREAHQAGDTRWGATPFRIGLWVGQRTTPNSTNQSDEAIKRDHGQFKRSSSVGGSGSPAQLTNCPWCGTRIDPGKHIKVDKLRGRTLIYCGDPLGDCPFSERQAKGEGLPALVVDEEIYRLLPALLIATVDKFAQLPWNGTTQMLFGQVDGRCERHGFRSPEIDDKQSHPATGGLPAARTLPHGPLRPPDLIIQDELHLISGPLGTLVGLYEGAVDRLASWDVDGRRVRPKVIASTATIRRAPEQIHALFLRQVAVFPPQGLDASDNFFARQQPVDAENPGRLYLGISAIGKRQKATLIRVYVAFLAAAQSLYEQEGRAADPYMTLVGYFNTVRELGGMRRLVDDDVRSRLGQADKRGLAKRKPPKLEELTSRKSATDIPEILDMLEVPFDPQLAARREQARQLGKPHETPDPLDVLLATNMISVGVDVRRLGLMVVSGQPKTTSEYIQATSRVGRSFPGLVCTIFNWARPRDLSHYEQFEHYHATFYQHVEALSVTPFSARALDRGLSALLVSYVRLLGNEFNANERAGRISRDHPYLAAALSDLATRAALVTGKPEVGTTVTAELQRRIDEWLDEGARASSGRVLGYRSRNDGLTIGLLQPPEIGGWNTFTCLNSLRDVEPSVGLILDDRGLGHEDERPYEPLAEAEPGAATDA
jgi:hypothetical protein